MKHNGYQFKLFPISSRPEELDIELQARPIETDTPDILLSPLKVKRVGNTEIQQRSSTQISMTQIGSNMMAYFNLRKFMQKLSKRRENFKGLNLRHLQQISDKGSDDETLMLSKKNKPRMRIFDFPNLLKSHYTPKFQIPKSITDSISKIPLIHPESKHKMIWDYCATFIRIVLIILIPLEISFKPLILFQSGIIFTIFALIIMILDILLRLNTVYYLNGKAIYDRMMIFNQNIKEAAIIDMLPIMAIIINFGSEVQLLLLLYSFQLKHVLENINKTYESAYFSKTMHAVLKLIWFIFTLILTLHIFSCIWFAISTNSDQPNWATVTNIINQSWNIQYLEAFYFATVTMLTIGYGDSVPQNTYEKMVAIIFILGACLWYSYAVNTIGYIIEEISANSVKRGIKIRVINAYMSRRKVPYSLQYKIREYLNYRWIQEESADLDSEETVLAQLSKELKNELEGLGQRQFLDKCMFLQKFSQELSKMLRKSIQRVIISPQNTFSTDMRPCLCFVEQGQLQIGNDFIQEGQFIEVLQFITEERSQSVYKAMGYVSLLLITKEEFLKVLTSCSDDHEKYCQIRDDLLMQQSTQFMKCTLCDSSEHQQQYCPLVSYKPDRELIIKKHCYPQRQMRRPYNRTRQKDYFKAVGDHEMIQEYALYLQNEKPQLINEQLKFLRIQDIDRQMSFENSPCQEDMPFFDYKKQRSSIILPQNDLLFTKQLTLMPKINLVGIQKSRTTDLEKSISIKKQDKAPLNQEMLDNIHLLNKQMQKDGIYNELFWQLVTKLNQQEIPQFDQVRSYVYYQNKHNVEICIKSTLIPKHNRFQQFVHYMNYPATFGINYISKRNETPKKKLSMCLSRAKNLMKFKNKLLNKKSKLSQVSPQLQQ